ncbi:MAG: exodeoxyribonuclease VII large subunit [Phycisphaeraceae bacterium]|nr:exodeoxyribonuclease VII large subunit [Phycisphaeraceae bacterium]
MGRLPFDPAKTAAARKAAARAASEGAESEVPLSVSQLAAKIAGALHTSLPSRLRLVGQVSGLRERTHWYFDLKDEAAVLSCVVFASSARKVRFRPEDGMQVELTGRIDFYVPGGKVSFIAESVEPLGAGPLELAFRRLCEELRALGWFDDSRKRPLPLLPRRVAVVTSRSGAALQDVLDTARRRCPAVDVVLVDVRVQGAGAAPEIARAVREIGAVAESQKIDVILLTRGGGSMEDLWAFNERIVAEAIDTSPVPVVAAIGHETDTTIAELVADMRASTPTQAAMRVFPDASALRRQIESLGRRLYMLVDRECRLLRERLRAAERHPLLADPRAVLDRAAGAAGAHARTLDRVVRSRLGEEHRRLATVAARLERQRPIGVIERRSVRLDAAAMRMASAMSGRLRVDLNAPERALERAMASALRNMATRLEATERQLAAVGPQGVLRRGFSVTLNARGEAIRSTLDVSPGETLVTRVADGEFGVVVEGRTRQNRMQEVRDEPPKEDARQIRTKQMGLFGE